MKISALLIFFLTASASAKPAPLTCDIKSIRKTPGQNLYIDSSKQVWLGLSDQIGKILQDLGMKKVKSGRPANLSPCPNKVEFSKLFGRDKVPWQVFVRNACEEKRARQWGLREVENENYGSMETGPQIHWEDLNVCTDGKKIYHCPRVTDEMKACLARFQ